MVSRLSFLLALALLVVAPMAAAQAPPPTPPPAPSAPAEGGDDGAQDSLQVEVTVPKDWAPLGATSSAVIFIHPEGGTLIATVMELEGTNSVLDAVIDIIKRSGVEMVGKPVINSNGTVTVVWQKKDKGKIVAEGRFAMGSLLGCDPAKPTYVTYEGQWGPGQDALYGPLFEQIIKDGIFKAAPKK